MNRVNYQTYADLVAAAYKNYDGKPISQLKDFVLIPGISTRMATVYTSDKRHVVCVAIRGTANWADIKTDTELLLTGMVNPRVVDDVEAVVRHAVKYAKGHNMSVVLAGHSLGGTIAIEVGAKNAKDISAVYAFAVGVPPTYLANVIGRKSWCKFTFNLTDACKFQSRLAKRTYIFTTGSDPISLFSLMMGATRIKQKNDMNSHTINNFTSVERNFGNELGEPTVTEAEAAAMNAENPNKDTTSGGAFRPHEPPRAYYKAENVAKIWKRARKFGVKPYTQPLHPIYDYQRISERYASLPEVAKMMLQFKDDGNKKGYEFLLRAMNQESYSNDFGLRAELCWNRTGTRIYNQLQPPLPSA